MLNSNFGNFGMPIDNAVPADTSVAVSSWYFYNSKILLPDLVISWSLFAAAMTTNSGLRSERISRVYNLESTNLNISYVFPVYYDSSNGTALKGIGPSRSIPNQAIIVDGTQTNLPTRNTEQGRRNCRGIVGGIAAIFAVIFAVIGITTFDGGDTFDPNVPETTQNSGITPEQRPSVTEEPGAETVALRRLSSLPPTILPAKALTTQQPDKPRVSTSNAFPPTSSPTAVAETGAVERYYHSIPGDYIRKSSRCGWRWSDFVQRDWLLRHRRATRREMKGYIYCNPLALSVEVKFSVDARIPNTPFAKPLTDSGSVVGFNILGYSSAAQRKSTRSLVRTRPDETRKMKKVIT
ncbi:hypothetical protein BGY98DRAFT_933632 [Russula aff. rugulosa BPL654]|nr:hypothetical protein BGY98DRAFT_933632 [Russula aff. rugulosa BPL654]